MTAVNIDSGKALKSFARCIASSVFVVTTTDSNGKPHGATIIAGGSLSLSPPTIMVCLAHSSKTLAALRQSGCFRLHVLRQGQEELSRRFASKDAAKCIELASDFDHNGSPVLDGVVAAVACQVVTEFVAGDHAIVVGALDTVTIGDGAPLIYHHGDYAALENACIPHQSTLK